MERVSAECRKCGAVFTTAAKLRTTCPRCKAAVTVRRSGAPAPARSQRAVPIEIQGGTPGLIALGGVVALVIWQAVRDRK